MRETCFLALLSVLFAGLCLPQSLEYQVKAAFLLNFTKYIEWPAQPAGATMDVCILGDDPFGAGIDQLVGGESVGGNKIQVRRVHGAVPDGCRVLYVASNEKDIDGILERAGPGILTVGEGESFVQAGGVIAFVVDKNHVRFDINLNAANKAHLTVSAKLLSVAKEVIR